MKRLEITPEITGLEVRAAGDGPEHFTIRGHAAVFGRLSENLGGFRERIAPGAFRGVLDKNPDVRLLIDHQPSSVLARTTNGTLELREDPQGLHIWARVRSDLPEAAGLRTRLESGLVDQMSFAFMIGDEERAGEDEDGLPIYEVREASELFDVSTVTYGAYPQTDVSLVRMRMLDSERKDGEMDGVKRLSLDDIRALEGLEPFDREAAYRLLRLDDSTAAEEPAAVAPPDRELIRARYALRKKARLLAKRYSL